MQIEPGRRPRSPKVTVKVQLIAAHSYCDAIVAVYRDLLDRSEAAEADMEHWRFLAWKSVMFESEDWVRSANTDWLSQIDYPTILLILGKIQKELDRLYTRHLQKLIPLLKPLRELQDDLYGKYRLTSARKPC